MYRVLLVDDEPIICQGLQKIIEWEDFGMEITAIANSAEEALCMLEKFNIDIMLLDIVMPTMSGLELLQRLRESGNKVRVIIISAYHQFEYVHQALQYGVENYLLKPLSRSELSDTLLALTQKMDIELAERKLRNLGVDTLRDNILLRYAMGTIDEDELVDRLELLHISPRCTYAAVALAHVCENDGTPLTDEAAAELKSRFLSENGSIRSYPCICPDSQLMIIFLSDTHAEMQELASFIQEKIEPSGLTWFAAVSAVTTQVTHLASCYQECRHMLAYEFILPHNQTVYGMSASLNDMPKDLKTQFGKIKSLLSENRKEAFENELHQLFSRLKGSMLTPHQIKSLIGQLFIVLFGDLELSYDAANGHSITFMDIIELGTIDKIEQRIVQIADAYVFSRIATFRATHAIVVSMKSYVEKNYANDISLKLLAEHFHFNAAYLGHVFKTETGQLFSEYLCGYRMERAKELLLSTSLRASEIGIRVGIETPNYFSSMFKRIVGMYPTSYRALHSPANDADKT